MDNRFACYHCGKHLSFRLDQFGMRVKCPKCLKPIYIGMKPKDEKSRGGAGFLTAERLRAAFALSLLAVAGILLWRVFYP